MLTGSVVHSCSFSPFWMCVTRMNTGKAGQAGGIYLLFLERHVNYDLLRLQGRQYLVPLPPGPELELFLFSASRIPNNGGTRKVRTLRRGGGEVAASCLY